MICKNKAPCQAAHLIKLTDGLLISASTKFQKESAYMVSWSKNPRTDLHEILLKQHSDSTNQIFQCAHNLQPLTRNKCCQGTLILIIVLQDFATSKNYSTLKKFTMHKNEQVAAKHAANDRITTQGHIRYNR